MESTVLDFYKLIWTTGFIWLTVFLSLKHYMDIRITVFSYLAFVAYHIFMGFTTGWGYNDLSIISSYIFFAYFLPKFIKKYIDQ